jgi:uncharacterized protein YggE
MSGIEVSGLGEAAGRPDKLSAVVGVSVVRATVAEAMAVAAQRANAVHETLRGRHIAADDIRTQNYSIGAEYDHRRDTRELVGYRVDNTLSATLRDLDAAGDVLDAIAAAAGDEVRLDGVTFQLEDDAALMVAAREAAWVDAEQRARQLAELAGVTLGAVESITESTGSGAPPLRAAMLDRAAMATPIEPGQQAVTVHLTVTFAIAP